MGMLFAQMFKLVWCKVNDQQPAAWPQDTGCLCDRKFRLVEEMQYLVNRDEVEILSIKR